MQVSCCAGVTSKESVSKSVCVFPQCHEWNILRKISQVSIQVDIQHTERGNVECYTKSKRLRVLNISEGKGMRVLSVSEASSVYWQLRRSRGSPQPVAAESRRSKSVALVHQLWCSWVRPEHRLSEGLSTYGPYREGSLCLSTAQSGLSQDSYGWCFHSLGHSITPQGQSPYVPVDMTVWLPGNPFCKVKMSSFLYTLYRGSQTAWFPRFPPEQPRPVLKSDASSRWHLHRLSQVAGSTPLRKLIHPSEWVQGFCTESPRPPPHPSKAAGVIACPGIRCSLQVRSHIAKRVSLSFSSFQRNSNWRRKRRKTWSLAW